MKYNIYKWCKLLCISDFSFEVEYSNETALKAMCGTDCVFFCLLRANSNAATFNESSRMKIIASSRTFRLILWKCVLSLTWITSREFQSVFHEKNMKIYQTKERLEVSPTLLLLLARKLKKYCLNRDASIPWEMHQYRDRMFYWHTRKGKFRSQELTETNSYDKWILNDINSFSLL